MVYKLYDSNGIFLREVPILPGIIHTGMIKDYANNISWRKGQHFHRLDGPAIEWDNGAKEWWVDGKQHRIGGPAYEWPGPQGGRYWYINGKSCSELEHDLLYGIMKLKGLM